MAIKQIRLMDSVGLQSRINELQKFYDEQEKLGPDPIEQQGMFDRLVQLRTSLFQVKDQERELSNLISDGWSVYSQYPIEIPHRGTLGCQFVLYKPDNAL